MWINKYDVDQHDHDKHDDEEQANSCVFMHICAGNRITLHFNAVQCIGRFDCYRECQSIKTGWMNQLD